MLLLLSRCSWCGFRACASGLGVSCYMLSRTSVVLKRSSSVVAVTVSSGCVDRDSVVRQLGTVPVVSMSTGRGASDGVETVMMKPCSEAAKANDCPAHRCSCLLCRFSTCVVGALSVVSDVIGEAAGVAGGAAR
ncbi:hypothetical protein E2C01_043826 [Portunus trituberculatus]|uniref:Uncharacterized protein n=1 Tax=Portunus trituberculatus TaxID=210409 RepID=A0A5B7FWQ0_PORTR|nr:hypothetical protein [Portunus trituberculatus]